MYELGHPCIAEYSHVRCPDGLNQGATRVFGYDCFEFNYEEKTWNEASDFCSAGGNARPRGRLVQVDREEIQLFLSYSLEQMKWGRNGIWIGLKRIHSEWRWRPSGKIYYSIDFF